MVLFVSLKDFSFIMLVRQVEIIIPTDEFSKQFEGFERLFADKDLLEMR